MSFYSRKGDDGTTGWLGKGRLPKDHRRIEAVGTVDEASAAIGLARAAARDERTAPILLDIQRHLHGLMGEVAADPANASRFRFDGQRVEWLELQIEVAGEDAGMPGEFIVPGDSSTGAALALARTIVRRAERRMVELHKDGLVTNPALQQYLNRLSSLLFVLELVENKAAGQTTTRARKTQEGSTP
jgi:cob(I)alamin adenosyltransferase